MPSDVERFSQEPMSFFPHDSAAGSDVKSARLIHRCGWAGYGRWWRICEHMASIRGHRIAFANDEDVLILAGILGFTAIGAVDEYTSVEECRGYVSQLLDIGLLEESGGYLISARMEENALYFGRQRKNGKKGGRPKGTPGKRKLEAAEVDA